MTQRKARMSAEESRKLNKLLTRLNFLYGNDRFALGDFLIAIVEASESGKVAIADNEETATITINLKK